VRSVEIVTGDGRLRTIGADDDTGLFWGIRGGKGNFGIVTALDVDLVPVARLDGGGIFFAGEHAASVLHAWRTWVAGVPEEVTSSVALLRLPDADHVPLQLRGRLSMHLRIAYIGDAVIGEQLVAPMRAAAPALMDTVRDMPFTETDSIHMDPVEPLPVWSTGALLSELTPAAVEALLDTAGPNVEVPLIVTEVRHMGGALARPPVVPNAVSGRNAAFSVFAVGPGVPGLEQAVAAAAHRVLDALAPWRAPERLLNFLGPEENASTAYPPRIAARLQELKGRFDPHALFRHGHTLTARPDAVRGPVITAGPAVPAVGTTSFWRRLIRTAVAGLAASDPQAAALLACLATNDVSVEHTGTGSDSPTRPLTAVTPAEPARSAAGNGRSNRGTP
jgi:hypothetical protein